MKCRKIREDMEGRRERKRQGERRGKKRDENRGKGRKRDVESIETRR